MTGDPRSTPVRDRRFEELDRLIAAEYDESPGESTFGELAAFEYDERPKTSSRLKPITAVVTRGATRQKSRSAGRERSRYSDLFEIDPWKLRRAQYLRQSRRWDDLENEKLGAIAKAAGA